MFKNLEYWGSHTDLTPLLKVMDGYPVVGFQTSNWYDFLAQHKILISSLRYPTAESPLLDRIIISAAHELEDLDRLTEKMRTISTPDR